MKDKIARAYLTFFGAGLCPIAPGTAGSLAAAVVAYFLLFLGDFLTLILLSAALLFFSIKIIDAYEKTHEHDASEIVIDEVCGVFAAVGLAFAGASAQGVALHHPLEFSAHEWVIFALAVGFFRVFDIAKPSIIGRVDRKVPGGWGVMGDDALAGVFAGLATVVANGLYLKFIKGLL